MRRVRRFLAGLITASLLVTASPDASANGRFPESNAIFLSEAQPDLVVLRVTFGLLVSRDRGKTWGWVCERSIGSVGVEDPMYSIGPSGRMLASTFQGLSDSKDNACTFVFAGGPLANVVFVDLAEYAKDRKQVVAFASSYDKQDEDGGVLFKSQLFETKDEGNTFTALGTTFDPYLLGESVDYAPSDPQRIYVSAIRDIGAKPKAVSLVSTDHGATWNTYEIPLLTDERAVFLAGVDPLNADRVYARTQNAIDRPGRLLVSNDGGKTFTTAYTSQGAILGFALSEDGKRVWIGGPLDGVRVASTTDFAFVQKSRQPVQCLKLSPDGLWGCSSEKDGFVAGLSKDEGATWEAKLHFCDIKGALDCPAGTPTNMHCGAAWPMQRALLGCEPDAGADGGGADGGTTPPVPVNADNTLGGGCRCTTPGATSTDVGRFGAALATVAATIAAIGLVARRRRRR